MNNSMKILHFFNFLKERSYNLFIEYQFSFCISMNLILFFLLSNIKNYLFITKKKNLTKQFNNLK